MKKQLVLVLAAFLLQGVAFGVPGSAESENQLNFKLHVINNDAGALYNLLLGQHMATCSVRGLAAGLYKARLGQAIRRLSKEGAAGACRVLLERQGGIMLRREGKEYELNRQHVPRFREILSSLVAAKEEFVTQILPHHDLLYREVSAEETARKKAEFLDH